jgi:uncharacterized RDD family membrane protein YckC
MAGVTTPSDPPPFTSTPAPQVPQQGPAGAYEAYGPPVYPYPPEPTSPAGAPLAGFDKRLVAFLIDALILGGISAVILIPAYLCLFLSVLDPITTVDGRQVEGEALDSGLVFTIVALIGVVSVLSLALSYVYHVELALRGGGQTFGKRVAKIRIAPLDPTAALTRTHLVIRYFTTVAFSAVFAGWLVDGLFQLWDKPYRQCLHDKVAKTVVVRLST